MTIFYFTSTGNCLYVAKQIGGTLYSIPQLMKNQTFQFKDDVVGLIFPCYGFGMPNIVKRFLKQVSWEADYTFAISTYGNTTGAVLYNLDRFAAEYGKKFDYMNTLLMVDNYLPGFKMEDQLSKLPNKRVEANLTKIIDDIACKKTTQVSATIVQKLSTSLIQSAANLIMSEKTAQHFIVNDRCTTCGICAKVCPTKNITINDKVVFHNQCEACLGCVHACPHNAIHLKHEKSTARFRNEHVTLNEIIESNCQ